jgi:hypothetical protein
MLRRTEMGRKKKTENEVTEEVAVAMKAPEPTEREQRIVALWGAWESAKAFLTKERSETRTDLVAAREGLKDAMEMTLPTGDLGAASRKLHMIEVAWQDLTCMREAEKERKSIAKARLKVAFEQLNEAVSNTTQLGLDYTAAMDAADDEADEWDDDDVDSAPRAVVDP